MNNLPNINPQDLAERPFEVSRILNDMIVGRGNNVGEVTLEATSTETIVLNNLFESQMVPVLVAITQNAMAESFYISARSQGSFTITHTNNGQTDRTYLYIWVG